MGQKKIDQQLVQFTYSKRGRRVERACGSAAGGGANGWARQKKEREPNLANRKRQLPPFLAIHLAEGLLAAASSGMAAAVEVEAELDPTGDPACWLELRATIP